LHFRPHRTHRLRNLHPSRYHLQYHCLRLFFFNDPAPPEIYTLSLHDALPISIAPARTAANVFATACSVSLCAWMPTWSPGIAFTTAPTIASTSCGSVPPLVSHSTTQRAPSS